MENIYLFETVEDDIRRNLVKHLQRINIKILLSDINRIRQKSQICPSERGSPQRHKKVASLPSATLPGHECLSVAGGVACPADPQSYAGGSLWAPGRCNLAGQICVGRGLTEYHNISISFLLSYFLPSGPLITICILSQVCLFLFSFFCVVY